MKGAPAIEPKYETLNQTLAAAAQSGESLFFVNRKEQDHQVSMARIRQHALSIAADLNNRGVRKHDRVALVLPTSPEFVECFFGVLCAGAIPVPLYPPVRLGRLDEYHHRTAALLQAVDTTLVITDERIRRLLGVAVHAAAPRLGCLTASSFDGTAPSEPCATTVAADDVALIQFSSGTTYDPKPVALTHANLLFNLAAIERYIRDEATPNPLGVTWLPLYHDMGLIGNLLLAFYGPGPLVLLPPELFVAVPAAWLRAISRHRATCSAAPNFAFGLCLKRIRDDELNGVDLSTWSICLSGAETISAPVQQRFSDRFKNWGFRASSLTPAYGMAEASLGVTFKPAGKPINVLEVDSAKLASDGAVAPGSKELVSVGRPLAGVEIQIRNDQGVPVPPDRVGHIYIQSPSIMTGYYARADLTDQVLHNGWLQSGDLGFIHNNELFICGRHKDVIVIRGDKHAPQDFEAALDRLPGVRAGCAIAIGYIPAGADDEALAMLVETTPAAPPTLAAEIAARVDQRTHILPAHVELLAPGTLPRTTSGKLRRHQARAQWLAGTLSPPKKVSPVRLLAEAANGEFLHARARFARHTAVNRPPFE